MKKSDRPTIPNFPQSIDVGAITRAAEAIRFHDPQANPVSVGTISEKIQDGFVIHCKDGAAIQAIKTLADNAPGIIAALQQSGVIPMPAPLPVAKD